MWIRTKFDYKIRENGDVCSPSGKIVKPYRASDYYRVNLFAFGKIYNFCTHRLLALAFVPNPAPNSFNIVDHINQDKYDNSLSNLRWINTKLNALNTNARGVFYNKRWGKYVARVSGRYVGAAKNFDDAREMYLKKRDEFFLSEYNKHVCPIDENSLKCFVDESQRSAKMCVY